MRIELTSERKYQLLLQISQKLRDTLDLDEILNHLLDSVQSIYGFDAAGIFVLSRDAPKTAIGSSGGMIASVAERGFDARPPRHDTVFLEGKGIIGHVIHTGECVVLTDVRSDPRYVEGRSRTRSEVAVPLVKDERMIGALNIESDAPAAFDEGDVEILRFFADAASISIERAILHRHLLETKRIEEQLRIAWEVQSRMLPRNPPDVPGYDIAGLCIPTFEIGGDYFDYVVLPEDRLGLAVADVSGKGVPAALTMVEFRTLLRTHAGGEPEPARIAEAVNRQLRESIGPGDFVTCVYGVLQPENGRFDYVNCGHNPPLIVHPDGSTGSLESGGTILGMFEDARYEEGTDVLGPGDVLLLYTDGVVESADRAGREFGAERLVEVVRASHDAPASVVTREVLRHAREFSGSEMMRDDFTMVVVRRR
jgi:serine phosphatase RsbU (regulator of sigma subunit)